MTGAKRCWLAVGVVALAVGCHDWGRLSATRDDVAIPDVVPPTDAPRLDAADVAASEAGVCGGAGEECCENAPACAAPFECNEWVADYRVCGRCGVLGATCCPGHLCSQGSCARFGASSFYFCVEAAGTPNAAGGPCTTGMRRCGTDPTVVCVQRAASESYCVRCGDRGEPCCGAQGCRAGGPCEPIGTTQISICR
jgi:hypothetical protein